MSVRVLIADDQEMIRTGFRLILEQAGIEVVAEAADGLEAVEAARRSRPDVVLMDVRMPHLDGIEATRRLVWGPPRLDMRVLVLTTFDLDEYVYGALRAGASGFLLKDLPAEQLALAVTAVAAGDALLAPAVTRRLIERFASMPDPGAMPPHGYEELTDREREVFAMVARGLTNAQIAEGLACQRGDRQDPRGADLLEARPPRPRSGGGPGLRVGHRPSWRVGVKGFGQAPDICVGAGSSPL